MQNHALAIVCRCCTGKAVLLTYGKTRCTEQGERIESNAIQSITAAPLGDNLRYRIYNYWCQNPCLLEKPEETFALLFWNPLVCRPPIEVGAKDLQALKHILPWPGLRVQSFEGSLLTCSKQSVLAWHLAGKNVAASAVYRSTLNIPPIRVGAVCSSSYAKSNLWLSVQTPKFHIQHPKSKRGCLRLLCIEQRWNRSKIQRFGIWNILEQGNWVSISSKCWTTRQFGGHHHYHDHNGQNRQQTMQDNNRHRL